MYGVIAVDPKEKKSIEIVEKYAKLGFVGIKIHPSCYQIKIDEQSYDEFYKTCEKLGFFILFHTGVHGCCLENYEPILIDKLSNKYPNLKIILEHMGMPYHFNQAMAVVYNSKFFNKSNVYAGITGIISEKNKEKIIQLLEDIGSDRIIYGLDFPICSLPPDYPENTQPFPPNKSVETFMKHLEILNSFKLNKDDLENILGKTIEKLII
ncbi:MAG: amidohydrolase family protein [Candidatus Ratteibacteria bacterium]